MFAVERRGGYPWAEGFFGRNDTAPLPLRLAKDRSAAKLTVRICDDVASQAGQPCRLQLRCVLFGGAEQEQLEVRFNGEPLRLVERDPAWKDSQILFAGGAACFRRFGALPRRSGQRLLRLDYAIDPRLAKLGENRVELRVVNGPDAAPRAATILEKLEVHLHYLRQGSR